METRTEGWIAGLQLAAISMQGHQDTASFIKSFTGSHHFVLDYLIEEVLQHQSESVQTFLLHTSILDRLCGPLCDAVLGSPSASGQETLEYLERANLFIVPLDNERRWYRYHHLFAELLRQRLQQSASSGNEEGGVAEYHIRASQWYEDNGLELEAFQHAAAANDIERATRLMEGKGIPLHFHFAVATILNWLASLPTTVLDAKPLLWVRFASMALVTGQTAGVEERLQAAEAAIAAALQGAEPDENTRNLIGQIAAARATLALLQYQIEDIIAQSHRALEYLPPDNLSFRFTAIWALGVAYQVQGDRAAAERAFTEALSISQMSGKNFHMALASNGLGQVQELENRLYKASATYQRGLQLAGDYPHPTSASQTYLGLARICYEWNDLDAAERYGQQSLLLMRQFDQVNLFIISDVFLARLKLARGDVAGAAAMLAEAEQSVRQNDFMHRISEVAAAQVLVLLRQGDLAAAAHLTQTYPLPISQARVYLAQGNPSAALAVLEPLRRQMEAKGWVDEQLKVMVLQAVALHANGEKDKAVQLLDEALTMAQPGGFIRSFVDEGLPMAALLRENAKHGTVSNYVRQLLSAFGKTEGRTPATQLLIEPLSKREFEVLRLLGTELNGPEIARELMVSLNTVRTHTKSIYNKLGVNNRLMAIRRAEELNLL
ncbi:MAG: LuxR C-terminal-related transcriptional regulator [Flexilinea sp.]